MRLNRIIRHVTTLTLLILTLSVHADDAVPESDKPKIEFLHCKVLVVDPDGNPVQDALVYCTGMRTRIGPGSFWYWVTERYGPVAKLKTGEDGVVEMPYPKYTTEKLEVGAINWTVEHPDFVHFREDRSVDGDPAEIELARGFRIAVTAVNGVTGEKIKNDLYAVIGGSKADWKLANNGMLVSPMFAKKDAWMRICRIVEGQPTLFSESIKVEPGERSRILLKDVKLAVGTRVEGKLDENVPRPVKNGYVSAFIARSIEKDDWSTRWYWNDKTAIKKDGSFAFDSLPPDEVLQLIPVCDGWAFSGPTRESVRRHFPDDVQQLAMGFRTHPMLVELKEKLVSVELGMKKSTSVKVTVKDPSGDPLPSADVAMAPNQFLFNGGSQILGTRSSQPEILVKLRAGGSVSELTAFVPNLRFKETTDENGVAIIRNLPVTTSQPIGVSHDDYDMPIDGQRRFLKVDLTNTVTEVTIEMQEKGTDALGE